MGAERRDSISALLDRAEQQFGRIQKEYEESLTAKKIKPPLRVDIKNYFENLRSALEEAEKLAGLEKLDGTLWHAYRRKWATERKHHPDADVAAAGGWANPNTLRLVYQQADQDTMLQVVLELGELREAK